MLPLFDPHTSLNASVNTTVSSDVLTSAIASRPTDNAFGRPDRPKVIVHNALDGDLPFTVTQMVIAGTYGSSLWTGRGYSPDPVRKF